MNGYPDGCTQADHDDYYGQGEEEDLPLHLRHDPYDPRCGCESCDYERAMDRKNGTGG